MVTAKSNPFDNIEGLLEALKAAPQDKEGAFRVSTWKMVIEEIVRLKKSVGDVTQIATNRPSVDDIKKAIEKDIKEDLSSADADKFPSHPASSCH